MRIKKLELKNFKRFTDLTLDNIPEEANLVLLIGSNGSGKSSIFDAFELLNSLSKNSGNAGFEYYRKNKSESLYVRLDTHEGLTYDTTEKQSNGHILPVSAFYGRTSFRQTPRLTRTTLGQGGTIDFRGDSDRPRIFIEKDNRFENDVEKITEIILKDLFRSSDSKEQIRDRYIKPINIGLKNIFGDGNGTKLQLIEIIPPLEGKVAQINFKKGKSEIHYDILSAGEKEVFNILLNLLSRSYLYSDTIYFLDELDIHLNTKLQYNLIKEITENWISEKSQLWTATHSLGFIEYAQQTANAVIFDFDDFDFDEPKVLNPEAKDNPDVYDIAVGKEYLPSLFRNMEIYFVENKDKVYYASIGIANTLFVADNNRNNVYHKVRATEYKGIVDRDFLSDDDIREILGYYSNLRILNYYSIENYMYHPDNLEDYHTLKNEQFDKAEYITALIEGKNQVKDAIIPSLSLKRTEYPYFGEPAYNGNALQKRFKNNQENMDQSAIVAGYLNNDSLEAFYKVLPMKTYCTDLPQRQHIPKTDLVQTTWFKTKITEVLNAQLHV